MPPFGSQPVFLSIAFATLVLMTGAGSAADVAGPRPVSVESLVRVRFQDGHFAHGIVDARTDAERLWLRTTESRILLVSGFAWSKVVEISVINPTPDVVSPGSLDDIVPPPGPFLGRPRDDDSFFSDDRGRIRRRQQKTPPAQHAIQALHIESSPANWDADHLSDGLRVLVAPVNQEGEIVPVHGRINFELTVQRVASSQDRAIRQDFPVIERWSVPIQPSDFHAWGASVELPFRRFHPERDFDVAPHAVLHARLSVPSVGVFAASDAALTLRPYIPIRDALQHARNRRTFPNEHDISPRRP